MKKSYWIAATLAAGLIPAQASATPPVDVGVPCAIDTIDSSLRGVLMMIGRNKGVRVRLSEKVNGVVSGSVQNATCDQLFDFLVNSFSLLVFHDGEVLHIATMEESESKVVYLKSSSPADIMAQIKNLGLSDQGDGVRYSEKGKVIYISGHEKYVELVEDLIEEFENQGDVKVLYGGSRAGRGAPIRQLEALEK